MITISQSEDDNFYCPDCVLKFGSIFDAEGNTYCPRCKKLIDKKLDGITRIDQFTYLCDHCGLKFGAVLKDGDIIKCPACLPN